MELWDKMFSSEDNIGLLVLKTIIFRKPTLFVKEFFKSDNLEWSYGTKCSILKIKHRVIGTQNSHLQKTISNVIYF